VKHTHRNTVTTGKALYGAGEYTGLNGLTRGVLRSPITITRGLSSAARYSPALLLGQSVSDALYTYADLQNRISANRPVTLTEQINSTHKTLENNTNPQIQSALTPKLNNLVTEQNRRLRESDEKYWQEFPEFYGQEGVGHYFEEEDVNNRQY
jgi:hypothetical protein